jgi:hypothetical protein
MEGEIAVAARFEQILVDAFHADKKKTLAVVSISVIMSLVIYLQIMPHLFVPTNVAMTFRRDLGCVPARQLGWWNVYDFLLKVLLILVL